eukprot:756356-Hanusia_phi.AAC.1
MSYPPVVIGESGSLGTEDRPGLTEICKLASVNFFFLHACWGSRGVGEGSGVGVRGFLRYVGWYWRGGGTFFDRRVLWGGGINRGGGGGRLSLTRGQTNRFVPVAHQERYSAGADFKFAETTPATPKVDMPDVISVVKTIEIVPGVGIIRGGWYVRAGVGIKDGVGARWGSVFPVVAFQGKGGVWKTSFTYRVGVTTPPKCFLLYDGKVGGGCGVSRKLWSKE